MTQLGQPAAPVRTICYSPTADVDATVAFYTDVLGFEAAMDHPVVGVLSPVNRTSQVLMPPPGFDRPEPAFGVDLGGTGAVDRAHAAVLERGLTVVYPLTDEDWGVRRFFVRDPSGTIVNILAHHDHLTSQEEL